jgi:hypothetical protein
VTARAKDKKNETAFVQAEHDLTWLANNGGLDSAASALAGMREKRIQELEYDPSADGPPCVAAYSTTGGMVLELVFSRHQPRLVQCYGDWINSGEAHRALCAWWRERRQE